MVLNSLVDLQSVVNSGVISNVALAGHSHTESTRREAIHMLANLLTSLCSQGQVELITDLCRQYEIVVLFFDILRHDYRCPENQRLVMMTLDEMFKLQDSQKD